MLSTSHIRTYLWGYSQRGQMCRTVTAWGRPSRNAISTIQYSAHWSGIKVEGGRSQHIHTDSCMQHIFFWNELTYCWSHQSPVSSAIFVDSASPSLGSFCALQCWVKSVYNMASTCHPWWVFQIPGPSGYFTFHLSSIQTTVLGLPNLPLCKAIR